MSLNITIFLSLLLFFILQETLENDQSNNNFSNELNEKAQVKEQVISEKKDYKSEESQEKGLSYNPDTYRDLAKNGNVTVKFHYRIAPKVPDFSSEELNWKNQILILELFVNINGDIEHVILKNIHQTNESERLFQKIKPVFLKAKFYPYIENGKAVAFRVQQPIEIKSVGREALVHKALREIWGERNK
ncbi:hypothetical protein MMO39_02765 [Acinetobacter modestus]|uniref:hypothetical protein n=1 Tax=Acinetobacter modestus TaxID=1776740 RepID=UPI001F4A736B|nr:hypothetical protein [Acinetobacter modestus]MCH7332400.1 hypothetical protein [Acinetobacter modestus]MCH7386228.1 hypothetical protein [Acinetobacter modestus]